MTAADLKSLKTLKAKFDAQDPDIVHDIFVGCDYDFEKASDTIVLLNGTSEEQKS